MSYQYSDYPYNLQADEMFDFTDISTAETAAALNEYQNLIINGQIDEAAQYLRDDTTGLKNCLIGAEVINTLQQRIHAVQDYALSLKTQGWYSEDAHDLDASIRLKGTMFRVKTADAPDGGVITDEYIKTETGGDYVKHYSNGFVYYEDGYLKSMYPITGIPTDFYLSNDTIVLNRANMSPLAIHLDDYVKKTGDSMTGALNMQNSSHINLYNSYECAGYLYARNDSSAKYVALASNGDSNIFISSMGQRVTIAANRADTAIYVALTAEGLTPDDYVVSGISGSFAPAGGSALYLGNASAKWKTVFATNGTINTSDRNQKHDIKPILEVYEKLFAKLEPVSYVLNGGERTHIGFIAQDVEAAMEELELTNADFAGFCKDEVDGQTYYGLRYSEFIALNTHMIQKLMKRVNELESRQ